MSIPFPRRTAALVALAAATLAVACPAPARAFSPFLVTPEPAVAEATAAYRYANMTDGEAMAEVDRRGILYSKVDLAPGVRAPIRLTGRLHGVYIHSSLPPAERVTTMFEILDARLALALDDFAAVLERHDIDEVVHFTMYRPNVAPPGHGVDDDDPQSGRHSRASTGKVVPPKQALPALGPKGATGVTKGAAPPSGAKQKTPEGALPKPEIIVTQGAKKVAGSAAPTKRPSTPVAHREMVSGLHQTTWAAPGTRHPAGLAIDVGLLHKKNGRWLSVAQKFQGHIGDKTCGEGARVVEDSDARELRSLVCECADAGVFTYVLTPDYNAAHADHFHMEIKPGVHWFLYH